MREGFWRRGRLGGEEGACEWLHRGEGAKGRGGREGGGEVGEEEGRVRSRLDLQFYSCTRNLVVAVCKPLYADANQRRERYMHVVMRAALARPQ